MYYNTTNEKGVTLAHNKSSNEKMDRLVMDVFASVFPNIEMTPFQVWTAMNRPDRPLTSVRRAMTNLTDLGLLEKTDKKQPGKYGRNEHFWKIV